MQLLLLASLSVAAGGTYLVDRGAPVASIIAGEDKRTCHRLEPEGSFSITGPVSGELVLRVDLPPRPRKPRPVKVVLEIDGEAKSLRLTPRRQRGATYEPPARLPPSAALKAIALVLPAGSHRVVLRLPAKRAGCLELHGVQPASAEPTPEGLAARASAERVKALLAQAQGLREQGRDFDAIVAYVDITREAPDNQQARQALLELDPARQALIRDFLARANDFFLTQDLASAAPYYQKVLQLDPGNAAAIEGLEMHRNLESLKERQRADGAPR